MDDTTNQLRCAKCLRQRFDGNHVIHLGYLRSFSARRDCRICAFVLAQLVKTRASQDSLVFLKPISESSKTYAIVFEDVESESVEGWISLLDAGYIDPHSGNGNKLDREQIKRWLRECQSTHHHSSAIDMVSQDLIDLVLIDVQSGMLVDAQPEWEFVALSYVNGRWGGSDFNLDHFTKDDLKAPGVLFSPKLPLPAVLRDAITLVRDLGQRYLWCDFICILRDNHAQKQAQIRQMDSIYGNAFFTIIALSGKHGNVGLPGVRANSRDSICPVVDLDLGLKAVARAPELENIRFRSVYNHRGWTYQEEILSQRCLYLTDSKAYFTCHGGYKREGEYRAAEQPSSTSLSHSDLFDCFEQDIPSPRPRIGYLFSLYGTLLRGYNERELTYDTDVIDAFYGISKILSRRFSTDFIFGLPQSRLHYALLWVPRMFLERRFPTQPKNQSDFVRLAEVRAPKEEMNRLLQPPTWSWAAWKGQVDFFVPRKESYSADSWIQHFGVLGQGGILPIDSPEHPEHNPLLVYRRSSSIDIHKWLTGDHHAGWESLVADSSKLMVEKHLHYWKMRISHEQMNRFNLQLFVLDLFRPGITLIYGMVHTLLEDSERPPELLIDLEKHEIETTLGKWQSISQDSLIQLDSSPPTPTELMQSWTAIKANLTLAYNGQPIWPFRSWHHSHSTNTHLYVLKHLLRFFWDTTLPGSVGLVAPGGDGTGLLIPGRIGFDSPKCSLFLHVCYTSRPLLHLQRPAL